MSAQEPHIESLLLQKIAEGDQVAFRSLFDIHWKNLYGVAYMLTKSEVMAEDMVQEIFLKLWLKRKSLVQVNDLRSYLFIMARNHIFNELRKKSKEISFTDHLLDYFEQKGDPEKQLIEKEARNLISQAVLQLPEQQRAVYELSRKGFLTRDQIAAELGISPNTVRNHMAKALESIRLYLEKNTNELLVWVCLIKLFLY